MARRSGARCYISPQACQRGTLAQSAMSVATAYTNDIGRARLRLAADLPLEPYASSRHGGSFLVIHPSDGATLAAGIVRG